MHRLTDEQLQKAYRYAMSLTGDHDVAMDVVHTTYAKLLGREVGEVKNLQGYFFRCIRNTFIDKKRFDERWLIAGDDVDVEPTDIGLATLEATHIEQDLLQKIWVILKPLERELLYLWAIEEYTIDEISHLTETSRGTLLSRIHRVRKKLNDHSVSREATL